MNLSSGLLIAGVILILLICWYLDQLVTIKRMNRVSYIHDRLDFLDPGVRPLSAEEDAERMRLLQELEELR